MCRHAPACPLQRTPCPQALKLFVVALRARTESSETMPHRGTDRSRTSVLLEASLCNRAASFPPHYRSNQRRRQRGRAENGLDGRLRVGGDRFARSKRSSSLLVCSSASSSGSGTGTMGSASESSFSVKKSLPGAPKQTMHKSCVSFD